MRLIDADALKKSIPATRVDGFENCRYCTLLDEEQIKQIIDDAPTIDAVPQWIPVENGLPKEGQRVLVTIQCNGNRTVYDTYRYDVTCWRGLGRDVNIIAWMPLPKPYERKES